MDCRLLPLYLNIPRLLRTGFLLQIRWHGACAGVWVNATRATGIARYRVLVGNNRKQIQTETRTVRRSKWYLFSGLLLFLLSASWFAFGPAWLRANNDQQAPAAPLPKVTVSRPLVREIIEWDEYTGRLEATESVEVRARVNGYLQSIHFKDGAIVKKGDLLFVIDPRPYQAELDRVTAELQLAQARLELAKSDYARAQKLLQFRAISQEEADTRAATEVSQGPRGPTARPPELSSLFSGLLTNARKVT